MLRQVRTFAGTKGTKIQYNEYNKTIMVTFYPTVWATASEMADFFQRNVNHIDGYSGHFRVDQIRTREHGLVSCVELNVPAP